MDQALVRAAEQVADRWTVLVVAALLDGPQRFTDLSQRLGGIAPNTLSSRLTDLEAEGLVVSTPYQRRPERFTYDLTEAGRDLRDVLVALEGWQARRDDGTARRHEACGNELHVRWYCPDCEQPAGPGADEASWV